ncbi:MAG TPA: hypothetical protein VFE82_07955 [Ramlibacter sp.]|jgi:hypothetical protein|uniref:hypothetical protein n=1 Tax=Ramlibacter sp. TaxID=1917967 RepID=UPI002D57FD46|nr:hypothetical protein [Ramlibacter sp.]HZY18400.1 hypothetical protein [Ramlibacter sp.]
MALHDRRASVREPLRLPVRWQDGRRGWTRDVSPDGLYVYLAGSHILHRWCALEIGFRQARLRFRALAKVLRVEYGRGVTGVALQLHARRFDAAR